jgi:alkylhydroperoxidase/carboxymuconolactone decarboxylase family protein YurZ
MSEERPLLDTVMEMTAASMSNSNLGARELMLVRLAALAAVDAPPASYLLNLAAAADAGLTLEDARGVLIAVAPIIGTPRTVSATGSITRALGFALDIEKAIEESQAQG